MPDAAASADDSASPAAQRSGAPGAGRARFGTWLFDLLTSKQRTEHPDVRGALLLTLREDRLLLSLAFFWCQALPAVAFWLTRAPWAVAWGAFNVVWMLLALRLRWRHDVALRTRARAPHGSLLALQTLWIACMGLGCWAALGTGQVTLVLLAAITATGFSGYIASRCAAFPRFACLLLYLLCGLLVLGLLQSPLPGVLPVGLLAPAIAPAFQVLMWRNHQLLVRALRAQQENRRLSQHDALTGLPNRLLLRERLAALGAHGDPFAVMCLDLDGFKAVNDRYGHSGGDWVLKAMAERLRSAVRSQDIVSRVGGDEFVIVLPGADRSVAVAVAERVLACGRQGHDLGGAAAVLVGVSLGFALAAGPAADADLLLRQADEALYAAKRAGKGVWRQAVAAG